MRIEQSTETNGHTFRCIVTNHNNGWNVRQERDAVVVLDVVRRDWRRVECDMMLFDYERRHTEN